MNPKLDLALMFKFIGWGAAHRTDTHMVEFCVVVLIIGISALYAMAATSLAFGLATLALLLGFLFLLYKTGESKGPPDDFAE